MGRLFLLTSVVVLATIARAQPPLNPVEQRRQAELRGQVAAVAAGPSDAELVPELLRKLADESAEVRGEAVHKLRLLSRRVDKMGGKRVQRGDVFEPKVPGLLPNLLKAADDEDEWVRFAAMFALADTLEPDAVKMLREKVRDPSERVRVAAACLLTEFNDATGLAELKSAVKRLGRKDDEFRYMEGEKVLASLERITGKSFGPIPTNPRLLSDNRRAAVETRRYEELFDAWAAWWDWTPPAK